MNVLFAVNDSFCEGLVATMVSLCANNPGPHSFYIMFDHLSPKNQAKIRRIMVPFKSELSFVDVSNGPFVGHPYQSLPRYYSQSIHRLLPQLAVPESVDRLLYLDTDVVVNGSLEPFYSLEFEGNYLIAPSVRRDGQDGGPFWDQEAGVYDMIKIELPEGDRYFNSGVLLLNVALFRNLDASFYESIVDEYREKIVFADQDILNIAFRDKTVKLIDRRLNCTIPDNMRLRKGEYRWIRDEVAVLHYVVWRKPWMPFRYRNRLFHVFMHYFSMEARPLSFLYRYLVWYGMKPIHFAKHAWVKFLSLLRGARE